MRTPLKNITHFQSLFGIETSEFKRQIQITHMVKVMKRNFFLYSVPSEQLSMDVAFLTEEPYMQNK